MTDRKALERGYECPGCSRFNPFEAWALAHMDIEIIHTCNCGTKNTLRHGAVVETTEDVGKP